MSKPYMLLTVLVLSVCIVAPAVVAQEDEQTEAKTRVVTLSQILKSPESFRNVPCEFTLTFHGYAQVYNPYFTRFVPENYLNFSAWADEQKIWSLQEYRNDFPFLFVDKRRPNLPDFLKLKRFDRFTVVGSVRDTFKGKPWIEVYSLSNLPGKLTEKALIHRVRGDLAMKKNRPRIAVKEYSQALEQQWLPTEFICDSTRHLGMALYRTRDFAGAQKVFARLASMKPKDKHAKTLAAQSEARAKEEGAMGAAGGKVLEMEPPTPDPYSEGGSSDLSGSGSTVPNIRK